MKKDRSGENHSKRVTILLRKDEFEKFQKGLANTTCWTMSEYGRKLLSGKPVTFFTRDQSLDAFIQEAITLRKSLQSMQGNEQLIPLLEEIKNCLNKIYDYVRENKIQ